ncbi:MAG: response regulator transcription factor [Fibrobacterales bacterium]
MKKIFIVEDEIAVAKELEEILMRAEHEVVGIAMSFNAAIKKLSRVKPDLILCDINLNGEENGLDLMQVIQEQRGIPFILMSAHTDNEIVHRASELGPVNYLTKPYSEAQLITSIALAAGVTDAFEKPTYREKSILQLLAQGMNSKAIGEEVGLSFHTVETHRKNMMKKYNVKSSAELMCLATSKKWITFSP